MYRLTKIQRKNQERVEAWLTGQPFREHSRDKQPQVPALSTEQVLADWLPAWEPRETGQFFTPLEMGRALIERLPLSSLSEPVRLLEPCAGIGHLVYHLADRANCEVTAYELGQDCARLGQRLFPQADWVADSPFAHLAVIEGQFDYVVMNPPYNIQWATAEAQAASVSGAGKSEHLFLELAARALKPDGLAAVIAPANLLDKLPKAAQAWFDERLELVEQFGPLPGEFALTGIRVHGFILRRLPEPQPPAPPALPAGEGLRAVIAQPALLQALRDVLPAASRNSRLAILENVLIRVDGNRLSLATSNLGTGIKTWVEAAAVGPAAEVCVPAHPLAELVALLPAEQVSLSGGTDLFGSDALAVSVAAPGWRSRANLRGLPAAEFPLEAAAGGQLFSLHAETLYRSIRQVRHFVDRDERLPVLGGILLRVRAGQLTAVATDRKCLALAVEPLPLPDLELVIELEALDVLTRHLGRADVVELELSAERVRFRLPQLEISGRLLSGDFPDYERVLPQQFATRAEVERLGLLALVDGAERFNRQPERVIELAVAGNGDGSGRVEVTLDSPALGSYRSRVAATVSGQPVQGRYFSQQLAQALRALPTERIALEFAGDEAPLTLRAGQSQQVLMPLAR